MCVNDPLQALALHLHPSSPLRKKKKRDPGALSICLKEAGVESLKEHDYSPTSRFKLHVSASGGWGQHVYI